ncbi:DUF4097 family beta strand repeat protein [bacterium]|nr:DUF4097 family beta strand repeat protein [bacterium]
MFKKKSLAVVALISFLSVAALYAAKETKTVQKDIDFISGGKISVSTVNGSIKINTWAKSSVQVFADITVKSSSMRYTKEMMDRVKINVNKIDNRLEISADYPKKNGNFFDWIFGKRVNVSVCFRITLPQKSGLKLRTVNGGITVENVDGSVRMESTNGRLRGEDLTGGLYAKTVNGSINVIVNPKSDNSGITLKSVNGGIKLSMPEGVKATLSASTVNGSIGSDFDVTISGKYASKKARGEINGGGARVSISTVNGGISIRKE